MYGTRRKMGGGGHHGKHLKPENPHAENLPAKVGGKRRKTRRRKSPRRKSPRRKTKGARRSRRTRRRRRRGGS